MNTRRAKRSRSSRQKSDLVKATVEFANSRYVLVRTEAGDKIRLQDGDSGGLLPGDTVFASQTRKAGDDRMSLHVAGIKRADQHLAVAFVCGNYGASRSAGYLEPVGVAGIGRIHLQLDGDLADGDYVLAVIQPKSKTRMKTDWSVRRIVRKLESSVSIARAVAQARHGIDDSSPPEVDRELDSVPDCVPLPCSRGRKDLRHLAFLTIDPPGAKDHDDAVYCEIQGPRCRLYVAIADVAEFVTPDSAIDRLALSRQFSLYFPDSSIPMLPEQLSGGICSLAPGHDRYALVCEMEIDQDGLVAASRFYEAVIHSTAKLTYAEADAIVRDRKSSKLQRHLENLAKAHSLLLANRRKKGTLTLNISEPSLQIDDSGSVTDVTKSVSTDMHSLIEEAMLAANVSAAEFLAEYYPEAAMYRRHDPPSIGDTRQLREILRSLRVRFPHDRPASLDDYIKAIDDLADRPIISSAVQYQILRSLTVAIYSESGATHFALNFDSYTHFTSPIRRYPDLVVHRMIKSIVRKSKSAWSKQGLSALAKQCSAIERKAEACMREAVRWLIIEYMETRIGETFAGVVTEVKEFGIFVQLESPHVDGMVPVQTLGDEYFEYDDRSKVLAGRRSGTEYAIGTPVTIRVANTDQELGFIDFEPADMPRRSSNRRRRRSR